MPELPRWWLCALATHLKGDACRQNIMRSQKPTEYDTSRIGAARREAIRRLDEFGCTVAEQRSAFGISESTFYRYAFDVRLSRRPFKIYSPGCQDESSYEKSMSEEPVMPKQDALEIATRVLLASSRDYSIAEIEKALNTSKSAVYRLKKAPTGAEDRWNHRHLPSHPYTSPVERARDSRRRTSRWKTRPRSSAG